MARTTKHDRLLSRAHDQGKLYKPRLAAGLFFFKKIFFNLLNRARERVSRGKLFSFYLFFFFVRGVWGEFFFFFFFFFFFLGGQCVGNRYFATFIIYNV